jgi:hypothetical protein
MTDADPELDAAIAGRPGWQLDQLARVPAGRRAHELPT